jgi:UDP-N-acetylenolpyruvoylglucosamine reductase
LPGHDLGGGDVKIPLGYVLDKICNLRGYAVGSVKLFEQQALVLVAERGTSAHAVDTFADEVAQKVFEATGIRIEREVVTLA